MLLASGCYKKSSEQAFTLDINGHVLKVETADEPGEMVQGLSGRPGLCADCGMLFQYSDYQIRNFWMNKMNFPLDIIWLKDNVIVGIAADVPILTDGEITRLSSPEAVNRVLEVNAGWVAQNGVKVGDEVEFQSP